VQKYVGQTVTGAAKPPVFGQWNQVLNTLSFDQLPMLPSEMLS
jgi:hypothetical protein